MIDLFAEADGLEKKSLYRSPEDAVKMLSRAELLVWTLERLIREGRVFLNGYGHARWQRK